MVNLFHLSLMILVLSPSFYIDVIQAQDDQPGFITIDCGLQTANYSDTTFNLYYISDAGYVDSGENKNISPEYSDFFQEYQTVRYFPSGSRNCYTLRPSLGKGSQYLIRARFLYGNYDGVNQPPKFDLHIGNQYWDTITIGNATVPIAKELIHTPSSDHIHVCLVKTGPGIPFISALELRPLEPKYVINGNVSLNLQFRVNINPAVAESIRFKDDTYDRIWLPFTLTGSRTLNNTTTLVNTENGFNPPSIVMSTAAEALNTSVHLRFKWETEDITSKHYLFLHFAELVTLKPPQTRVIDILLNDELFLGNFTPTMMEITTVYSDNFTTGNTSYIVDIGPNDRSTLPPIINAAEAYSVVEFPLKETFDGDVVAMVSIKTTYSLIENWQGDPCGPEGFRWNGVNCTKNDGLNNPKIISLQLSSKQLVGSVAPALSELKALQTLDLSNNLLTGVLPDFLADLDSLTLLNLKGNNFSGSCPQRLLDKADSGKLNLISDICAGKKGKKGKNSLVIPIAASVGGVVFLICASLLACYIIKGRKQGGMSAKVDSEANKKIGIGEYNNIGTPYSGKSNATTGTMMSTASSHTGNSNIIASKSRQFTYSEVLQMTNNFHTVIGKGGFGTVYHGYVGEAQVAVKMLSPSSSQGYKEFQSEASLLLTIHHKNLTSLVGYCYEGTNMAIIYDYMPNGNMEKHILGKGPYVSTWQERLRMTIDAAQGLEYLHHGCKPPIVHRDIKLTNILVDEKFRAKLADFGLSRAFSIEDPGQVSTVVAGTPGYLDPEYYSTGRLTEKSDIYSFGIILLEIVTGCSALPRNNEMPHIITWVSAELEKGDLEKVVDPKLKGDYALNSVWKVMEVAMGCVARNSTRRPTMNFVVMELNVCLEMETSRNETESKDSIRSTSFNMESGFNPQAR